MYTFSSMCPSDFVFNLLWRNVLVNFEMGVTLLGSDNCSILFSLSMKSSTHPYNDTKPCTILFVSFSFYKFNNFHQFFHDNSITLTRTLMSSESKQFCRLDVILFLRLSIDFSTFQKKLDQMENWLDPLSRDCIWAESFSPYAKPASSSQTGQVGERYLRGCRVRQNRLVAISRLWARLPGLLLACAALTETLPCKKRI